MQQRLSFHDRFIAGRTFDRRLILGLVIAIACCFGGFSAIANAQSATSDEDAIRLQYLDEELLSARVKLFGEESLFLIDTGASITMVSNRFQGRLGERLDNTKLFRTAVGTAVVPYYSSPRMTMVSGNSEKDVVVPFVGVVDLKDIQAALDRPIAGIIGMDVLKNYVLRLDFDEEYFSLGPEVGDASGDMKHIDFGKTELITPSIRIKISDDQFHQVDLDTGGIHLNFDLEFRLFQKLKQKKRIVVDGGSATAGIGGVATSEMGFLDEVELGDTKIRNLQVSPSAHCTLGLEFLERFESEFDFPNRKAYFRPGKRLRAPNKMNLSHFGVKIVNDKLTVIGCRGNAQDAGIRVGDILVQINGNPAREMSISRFRRLQCQPDTKLQLRFDREGKRIDVSLNLVQPRPAFPQDEGPTDPQNN